ncbi:MAG TPA: hypothetical protein PLX67_00465 [bacterium]|jgi:hypothetical protein|nr:hypothetical protein [bacterium]HNZ51224.1 hypothetical protein [bacterium]HOF79707.1 hypothetical protein [bacterium]HOH85119.1 hypothetical protein [bacterium]HOQ91684.1 hypothetical protein [bacterium]
MSIRRQIKIKQLNDDLYLWLTVTIAVLIFSEAVWPGLVSAYLNLSFWLLFWSVSAILKVVFVNK